MSASCIQFIVNLARHRLRNQRLAGAPLDSAADVVRWLGAVQAQDYHGAKWALGLRMRHATDAALDRAFDEGAFVRTHILRPTWHFVAPEDLRWMLALTAPRVHAVNAARYRELELDADVLRRGHALVAGALEGGRHLTRQELGGVLEAGGIAARGQRLAYLVMHAELEGLVCSGPRRGRQLTYALLDERVPAAPVLPPDEALAALARRYFAGHGPATVHDFAWWSGLKVSDGRRALEMIRPHVEGAVVEGKEYWTAAPSGGAAAPQPARAEAAEPVVHLLPNYDEHVVAYRDHATSCHPAALDALYDRREGGLDAHLVALGGMVVGGWRRSVQKAVVAVRLNLLVPLNAHERAALARAADAYGRFMGLRVVVEGG